MVDLRTVAGQMEASALMELCSFIERRAAAGGEEEPKKEAPGESLAGRTMTATIAVTVASETGGMTARTDLHPEIRMKVNLQ